MKTLKSSFTYSSVLFFLLVLSTSSNAQHLSAKLNMSTVTSSYLLKIASANYAKPATSIMWLKTKTKNTTAPASYQFAGTKSNTKFKPLKVALTKSNSVTLKLHYVYGSKASPTSTNKPFRFSAMILTVKF